MLIGGQILGSIPSGVARFVARKNAPLVDKSCSSHLNASNIEQMSYNRDGRLPLEVVEIWSESFWWSGVVVSYGDGSLRSYLHNHMKQDKKAPEYNPQFYVSD